MEILTLAARRGGLILVSDLTRAGIDSRPLRALCKRGELVRLGRGSYVLAEVWALADGAERHRLRVRAAAAALPPESVFSHYSAAALHGLPILGAWPQDVHVIGARNRGGHAATGLRRHGTINLPEPIEVDGLRATSVARTVVDLARVSSFASAIVTADCAIANSRRTSSAVSGATEEELVDELDRVAFRGGKIAARTTIGFANGLSGSVGESLSRAQFWQLGIPAPQLQYRFVDEQGEMFADFFWKEYGAIGEFDGKVKYFDPQFAQGLSPKEVLWKEKLRQDRLLAFAPRFVRWDWAIAMDPRRLLARLATVSIRPIP
jgi:predicted transcriptional regulator of viral defense system